MPIVCGLKNSDLRILSGPLTLKISMLRILKISLLTSFTLLAIIALTVGILKYGPLRADFPLPFVFDEALPPSDNPDDVLLMGDAFGKLLLNQEELRNRVLPSDFSWTLNAVFKQTTGAHRAIRFLKSLKRPPKVIFYFLGEADLYEQLLSLKAIEDFQSNARIKKETVLETWRQLLPGLSQFFFDSIQPPVVLKNKPAPINFKVTDETYQSYLQSALLLHRLGLEQMVTWAKTHGVAMLFINRPLDLLSPPKRPCSNSLVQSEGLSALKSEAAKGNWKKVYEQGLTVAKHSAANSEAFFFYGRASLALGRVKQAYSYLLAAKAIDCARPPIAHPRFYAEAKKIAHRRDVAYFDANQWLFYEAIAYHQKDQARRVFDKDQRLSKQWQKKLALRLALILKRIYTGRKD